MPPTQPGVAPLKVLEVTSAHELDLFLRLPFTLYANDPSWVPPLLALDRRRLSSPPEGLELKLFMAVRGTEVVGTISVLRDPGYDKHAGRKVAWFGYFEAAEDRDVVPALVGRAAEQAAAWEADALRGPRNLTRFEQVGLTVEGFDRRPPFLQGHHARSYAPRLSEAGLQPHHDVLAYEIGLVDELGHPVPLPEGLSAKAEGCAIEGLELRRASRRTMTRDLEAAHQVLNAAYSTVPDTAPMPRSRFVGLGRVFLAAANPELLQLALVRGAPAAFAVCFPELNEALVAARGRVLPLGWLRTALATSSVRTASFKLIGVVPKLRGTGLHAVMIRAIVEGVRRAGYTRMEASVIDERNGPMRSVVEGAGMEVYRRYRFYERTL